MRRIGKVLLIMVLAGSCGSSASPSAAVRAAPPPSVTVTSVEGPSPDQARIPDDVDLGPLLDLTHLPALPPTGVAVEYGSVDNTTVVFVAPDGTVVGHLVGFRLANGPPTQYGGPLALEHDGRTGLVLAGRRGVSWVQSPGPAGSMPLGGGARLEPVGDGSYRYRLVRADASVIPVTLGAIDLSADGRWLTVRQTGTTSYIRSTVFDVSTGATTDYDGDCLVADSRDDLTVLACGGELRRRRGTGPVSLVAGHPPGLVNGHWTGAMLSADGETLLAQYSGECEAPSAWFVPTGGGSAVPVARDPSIDAFALVWMTNSTALAQLGPGVCGNGPEEGAGVFVVRRDGTRRRVYGFGAGIGGRAKAWTTLSPR